MSFKFIEFFTLLSIKIVKQTYGFRLEIHAPTHMSDTFINFLN